MTGNSEMPLGFQNPLRPDSRMSIKPLRDRRLCAAKRSGQLFLVACDLDKILDLRIGCGFLRHAVIDMKKVIISQHINCRA